MTEPQPPYGQPRPPYAQSPYGMPQPCYGQPPSGGGGNSPMTPPVTSGRAGIICAVVGIVVGLLVGPLGLVFSIIGLFKSRKRDRLGTVLSIIGIAVSSVFTAILVALLILSKSLAVPPMPKSPAADTACLSAEADIGSMMLTVSSDDLAIAQDAGRSSAERADIRRLNNDTHSLQAELNGAQGQALRPSARAGIGAMISDLGTVTSSLPAVERGNTSRISQLNAAVSRLQSDKSAIGSLCS